VIMKHSKHDYPIEECAKTAADAINGGYTIYQRFSCERCGQRLTMDVPNQFFRSGACDKCGHTSDITHCNYTAIKQA